jgi:outer membrane protein, heavy metal efflux system
MKQLINTIAFALLAPIASAQSSVDNVLGSVAKNNKTLVASAQFAEAKKLEYKTGITPEDPRLEYDYLVGSPAGAGNQVDFSLTQSFDFPTAYFSKKSMANRQIAKTELELNALRQNILLEAKTSCFFLIYLNKKQAELKRRVAQVGQLYEGYQTKMKSGEATILDVNKAQLLLLNLKTEMALNESEIKRKTSKLTELNGGIPVEVKDTVYPIIPDVPEFSVMDSLIEANDIAVKIYNKDKDISSARLKVMKGLALPKVEAGYHSQAILGQTYQGAHLGISIPLWQNKNTIKAEKANLLFNEYKITEHRTEWDTRR